MTSAIKKSTAFDTQVSGNHYKHLAIQPMEYSLANNLDAAQHTAIKYVTRFRNKGGIEDLRKAIHTIEMLIEFESRNANDPIESSTQAEVPFNHMTQEMLSRSLTKRSQEHP